MENPTTGILPGGSAVVKLYFDGIGDSAVCLGGMAEYWWLKNYEGDYVSSAYFKIPPNYDPTSKSGREIYSECKFIC